MSNSGIASARELFEHTSLVLPTQYRGPLPGHVRLVIEAESLGLRSAWVTEVAGGDAMAIAAAASVVTSSIRIGVGVVSTFTRSAALIAMGAATVQALGRGRFVIGLGSSTERIVRDWHGIDFARPLAHSRETIVAVRGLLAGERSASGFSLGADPVPPPPIYFAALAAPSLRLAGRHADGAILTLITPAGVTRARETIEAAALESGRDPSMVEVVCYVRASLSGDTADAVEAMRRELWWYSASPVYRRQLAALGFAAEMEAAEAAWRANDRDRAYDAIHAELARTLVLTGDAAGVRAGVESFRSAGADEVGLYFLGSERGADAISAQLHALAQ